MSGARGNDAPDSAPVSPLSPKSEAIMFRHQNSVKRVSPQNSVRRPPPISKDPPKNPPSAKSNLRWIAESSESQTRPPAPPKEPHPPTITTTMPPRKPVPAKTSSRNGRVVAQVPTVVKAPSHQSMHIEHSVISDSRPNSIITEAVPDTFLQNHVDHVPPIPPIPSNHQRPADLDRPESIITQAVPETFLQTHVPPVPATQQRQPDWERCTCSHCGRRQRDCSQMFMACKKCQGVYYCSQDCWQERVCHSEKRCRICGLVDEGSKFNHCTRCKEIGKEVFYCSQKCFDGRNCHVRRPVEVPAPPPQARVSQRQQAQGQRQRQPVSNIPNLHLPYLALDERYRKRDVEAQSSSSRDRTGLSAIIWSVGVLVLILIIVIICVVASKKH